MHFDQRKFNFSSTGSEEGYRRWCQELEEKQRPFETRWGVILSRRVIVSLKNHAKPPTGLLETVSPPRQGQPVFRIKGLEFTPADIESMLQAEPPATPLP